MVGSGVRKRSLRSHRRRRRRRRRHGHLRRRRPRPGGSPRRGRRVPDVVQGDSQLSRRGCFGDGGQGAVLEERGRKELGRRRGGTGGGRRSDSGGGRRKRRRDAPPFVVVVDLLVAPRHVVPVGPPVEGNGAERDVGASELVLGRLRALFESFRRRRRGRRRFLPFFSRHRCCCRDLLLAAAAAAAAVQGPPEKTGLLRGRCSGRGRGGGQRRGQRGGRPRGRGDDGNGPLVARCRRCRCCRGFLLRWRSGSGSSGLRGPQRRLQPGPSPGELREQGRQRVRARREVVRQRGGRSSRSDGRGASPGRRRRSSSSSGPRGARDSPAAEVEPPFRGGGEPLGRRPRCCRCCCSRCCRRGGRERGRERRDPRRRRGLRRRPVEEGEARRVRSAAGGPAAGGPAAGGVLARRRRRSGRSFSCCCCCCC